MLINIVSGESLMRSLLRKFILIFLPIALIASIFLSVAMGSVNIGVEKVWGILLSNVGIPIPVTWTEGERAIVLVLRFPRAIAAIVVGGMLGIAGVAAQGLFKNPIAEPYIIGISSAAGFGTAMTLSLGLYFLGMFTSPIISFTTAILAIGIIYKLSQTRYRLSMSALLLSGIAISFFFSALTSFLLYTSEEQIHYIMYNLMGSFWGVTWTEVYILFSIFVFGIISLFYLGRDLNLMVFGDETAQTTGVNVERSKKWILLIMTVLTSVTVAFCGSIGFVGLIIPHLMRFIVGSNHRALIPATGIAGGILLLWADVLARTLIAPLEIPVGIFTALLGGPFFVYLVLKRKKEGEFA